MFCFLILRDQVAEADLSDVGYFHIEGPKLDSATVLALHLDCLQHGWTFTIEDDQGRPCYEGRLSPAPTAADLDTLAQWAKVEVPSPRVRVQAPDSAWSLAA